MLLRLNFFLLGVYPGPAQSEKNFFIINLLYYYNLFHKIPPPQDDLISSTRQEKLFFDTMHCIPLEFVLYFLLHMADCFVFCTFKKHAATSL